MSPWNARTRNIPWSITRTVAPTGPAVSADELVSHLRGEGTLDVVVDVYNELSAVADFGAAAEEAIEGELSACLLTQTWELRLEAFPCYDIWLPRPPLQSVTSVVYVDTNGVSQTLSASAYTTETTSSAALTSLGKQGRIYPIYGTYWPSVRYQPSAVVITYVAGQNNADFVPSMIKTAIKLTAAEMYENRERSAVQSLQELALYERLVANHRCVWDPCYR